MTTDTPHSTPALRWAAPLLAAAGLVLLGACGAQDVDETPATGTVDPGPTEDVPIGGDDPTLSGDTVDPGEEGVGLDASLAITVTEEGDSEDRQALLECGPDGAAGVLWLEGDAAEEACAALEEASVIAALLPPEDDDVCNDVLGGSEVATVTGNVDELQVDAVVDRRDSCGIDRFDALRPLLPAGIAP